MKPTETESAPETIAESTLAELPIFPLPGTVLLPQTLISLHIFEPRYRRMMADVSDSHRTLAIALIDEDGAIDAFGRPRIHPIVGVGVIRRSAKLPDGRYNLVLEGVARADVRDELPPDLPYRRARARLIQDETPESWPDLDATLASVRALYGRLLSESPGSDPELVQRLNEVSDPGALAHVIAAAAIGDPADRQRILEESDVRRRLDIVAAALGAILLKNATSEKEPSPFGWGVGPAKA